MSAQVEQTSRQRRDAALAALGSTREAERSAREAHIVATDEWLTATCGETRRGTGWCTEEPGHLGDHANLRGARWSS